MLTFDRVPLVGSNVNDPVAVALPLKLTLSRVKVVKTSARAAVRPPTNRLKNPTAASVMLSFDFMSSLPSERTTTAITTLTELWSNVQAIRCRRRHQPSRPPLAKIRPGRPDPMIGPGTGVVVVTDQVPGEREFCPPARGDVDVNPLSRINEDGRLHDTMAGAVVIKQPPNPVGLKNMSQNSGFPDESVATEKEPTTTPGVVFVKDGV
jgi:hypothetical protein